MSEPVTLEAILSALGAGGETVEGYHTRGEWGEVLGIGEHRLYNLLHLAKRQGKLSVRMERRETLAGTQAPVLVYRFLLSTEAL